MENGEISHSLLIRIHLFFIPETESYATFIDTVSDCCCLASLCTVKSPGGVPATGFHSKYE